MSDGNEGVLRISQSSSTTETSPSDYLVSYQVITALQRISRCILQPEQIGPEVTRWRLGYSLEAGVLVGWEGYFSRHAVDVFCSLSRLGKHLIAKALFSRNSLCTTWTLTKRLEKKLDGNYTRMLRAILNKSWQQHPTRHQLYGHLPPITKTIQVRRTRHAGHCWRSRDELIRDVLLWIPTHGRAKAGRPARTYIQQLCEDTGCCPEDLPRAMNDREEWRERVRDIRATSAI